MSHETLEIAPAPSFQDEAVAERYLNHYKSIRGEVRTAIVRRHLLDVLSLDTRSLNIVDIGCGDARDALWLASLGHSVLAVDPSETMMQHAEANLNASPVPGDVELQQWSLDQVLAKHAGAFDLVVSHGVIMYAPDPSEFLRKHFELAAPGGALSLLTKNALVQPHRAVDEGKFSEALRLLDEQTGPGRLGVTNRSHSTQEIADIAAASGALVRSWAGVRVFSDRGAWDPDIADPEKLLELEWRAAREPAYRSQGALLHFILTRGLDLGHLPALE